MNKFVLTTDYTADLSEEFYEKTGIERLILPFTIGGQEYDCRTTKLSYPDFYNKMRAGETVVTSQVSQYDAMEVFAKHLEAGEDILHICFSSGVSSSFDNFGATVKELKAKFPDRKIYVVDSLSGAGCLGMMVDKCNQMKNAGKSIDKIKSWIETNRLNFQHFFIVDDLSHLRRGGRLSGVQALIGTILGVKPVLGLNHAGKILPVAKLRGQKKAFQEMINITAREIKKADNEYIVVGHGDNIEFAKAVGEPLSEQIGLPIVYNNIDYLIGAHAGPNVVAVFFYGNERKNNA